MSIIQRLTGTVGTSTYVCRYCRLTFDTERPNCPACGCEEITAD